MTVVEEYSAITLMPSTMEGTVTGGVQMKYADYQGYMELLSNLNFS